MRNPCAFRFFAATLALSMLAACGNKGPLVRPPAPPGTTPPPPPAQHDDSVPIPGSATH